MNPLSGFPKELKHLIINIAEKEGYLEYKTHEKIIPANGGSYFGEIYKVDITGKTKEGDKQLNLFIKVNKGSEDTTFLSMNDIYQTELFAYNELFKILAEIQEDANVPLPERYKMVKFYEDSTKEAIILEDIAMEGYITYHRMDVVPLQFAELAIKELAKLHALSFGLEEKRPEYFNNKIKNLKIGLTLGDDWLQFVKGMMNVTIKYVDEAVRDKVENTYRKLSDQYPHFFKDKTTKLCICHGDYKAGNIMMKIIRGEASEITVVDYQWLHYGCPAMDFIYFIFMTTDKKFRDAHLSYLKDLYHETLRKFLEYFKMDVELVYPRKMFDDDYKQKLGYGVLIGYVLIPLVLVPEDSVPDLTGALSPESLEISELYKERQRGMIEEFIEWGCIV